MEKATKIFSRSNKPTNTGKSRAFGHPIIVVLTAIAIFISSQFIAGIIVGILFSLSQPGDVAEIFDDAAPQFFFVLLAEALAIWLVYWVVKKRRQIPLSSIGLGRKIGWRDVKAGLLGFGAYYLILIATLALVAWLIPSLNIDQPQDVGFENIKNNYDHFFAFTSLVLLAPIGEEVVMRGYLYSGLRSRLKYLPSLLITSLVFGIAHLEFGTGKPLVWAAAIVTFVLSAVLVRQREKTGAIYAGILIHMLNNLVAFIVQF